MEGYRNADLVIKGMENAGPNLDTKTLISGLEAINDYTDLFGYHMSFGPQDHSGVEASVLSIVVDGRWTTQGESISY